MRLIFHGELRKRFGASVEMAGDTIAEAIEGFSRQVDWPKDMPVRFVGYDSEHAIRTAAPAEVHVMPAMLGGGGKFFNIIVGAVLIVVGILLLPNPIGISLIVSGSVMVLQGIVQLFMKSPSVNQNEDPEASKYLNPNRNTVASGTPITKAYGTIDLAGHWLSLQSNSSNLSYATFPANPT